METETSIIFIFWSGFNFTIEFTKNPEGNSYYMNRAILVYDTEHPDLKKDFELSETHGKVHLETRYDCLLLLLLAPVPVPVHAPACSCPCSCSCIRAILISDFPF